MRKLFHESVVGNPDQTVEFIANILESSTEHAFVATDLNGTILLWNEGAHRLFGPAADEVIGKANVSSLWFHESEEAGASRTLFDSALLAEKWQGILQCKSANRPPFPARVVITPRFDANGEVAGFLFVLKDVSDELRASDRIEAVNRELVAEIQERRMAEADLRKANEQLSARAMDLEERTQELRLLTEMSELLQACESVEEAHRITTQFANRLFPLQSGVLYLARNFGDGLEAFATWGYQAGAIDRILAPVECWALRRGRSHVVENPNAGAVCPHLSRVKPSGFICVPMMTQGQTLGLLHVAWDGATTAKDAQRIESTRRLAIALADATALALSNVRLRDKLKEETTRDPLTQLYNRRYLQESLDREVSRAQRARGQIGIIMVDIDHFKRFNDCFGHQTGDAVLRDIAQYLRSRVRPEDIPARYGGEEFALVMPGAGLEIVRLRAEGLRKGIRGIGPIARENSDAAEALTLSMGIAVYPDHGASGASVLRAADEALYVAKESGRDCVVVAELRNKIAATREFAT